MKIKKNNSIQVFLVTPLSALYQEGMMHEFKNRKVEVFFINNTDALEKQLMIQTPDVIVLDEPESKILKSRIFSMVDFYSPKTEVIFLSKKLVMEKLNLTSKTSSDQLSAILEVMELELEEFLFTKSYKESFREDVIVVGNKNTSGINFLIMITALMLLLFGLFYFMFI